MHICECVWVCTYIYIHTHLHIIYTYVHTHVVMYLEARVCLHAYTNMRMWVRGCACMSMQISRYIAITRCEIVNMYVNTRKVTQCHKTNLNKQKLDCFEGSRVYGLASIPNKEGPIHTIRCSSAALYAESLRWGQPDLGLLGLWVPGCGFRGQNLQVGHPDSSYLEYTHTWRIRGLSMQGFLKGPFKGSIGCRV